jgi:hypothetical protein
VKECFANKKTGFRWKQLTNDKSGKRAQVMAKAKPKDYPAFEGDRKIIKGQEPIMVKAGLLA